ncbi:Phenylhydantoinase [Rhodotorula toruloides ATCC 204091]|uniref:dihydropyrimidinase n=1 Tax=Rhodotorula toruloides TaxID=5286 RepID=A0A0K3CS64_RHOTO|nr:Phenylhydantoinase [Rhodotorula toruloides ATCC 204091]KAK4333649.1 Allantoinase [Rhodotorula toruloides]PRQ69856.1 Phenylhydantoinase [Rhodotorula toruloides]
MTMTSPFDFDLVVKNGFIVTASDTVRADIGVKDGKVVLLMADIPVPADCEVIDAEGGFVTPGLIDSHVHIAQSAAKSLGAKSADNWTTASQSAVAGGCTTVIAFAVQNRGTSMQSAVDAYHDLATNNAVCDYSFHVIVTDPSEEQMHTELPKLIEQGITSVKIYSTYPALKLSDEEILNTFYAARQYGVTVMVHAENSDMIAWMTRDLAERGMTEPWHHGTSRPPIIESEATNRVLALSELMDCPVLFVHVSAPDAFKVIREAQTRLMSVFAETCPHYLLLTAQEMKAPGFEGAKACCAPPLRENPEDRERVWENTVNGTVTVVSSDHAPTKYYDEFGKQLGLTKNPSKNPRGDFRYIPNGLPGVETRGPLMWSEGVCKGRMSPNKFVELNCTNAAKLYGMYPQKGTIQPGSDADFVVWRSPSARKTSKVTVKNLHSACDYTPFEGHDIEDWPVLTILRGKVIYDGKTNEVVAEPGYGAFLKRGKSSLQGPRNKWLSEWRPKYMDEQAKVNGA